MKIKEILNEFQLDWASAQTRLKKYPFEAWKKKKIVIAGMAEDGIAEALVDSFLYANDCRNLGMQVLYCCLEKNVPVMFSEGILERNDFACRFPEQIRQADVVILSGISGKDLEGTAEEFQLYYGSMSNLLEAVGKWNTEQVLLLSDERMFDERRNQKVSSEYETMQSSFAESSDLVRMTARTMESLCANYGKQKGFSWQIVRTAMVYGAGLNCASNFITDVACATAEKEPVTLVHTGQQHSYVYISDVITAVWHILLKCPKNRVFHVTGKDSLLTMEELFAVLYRNFPDQAKITFGETKEPVHAGKAMNSDKLALYGWEPAVSFEDGMILLVKSLMGSDGAFMFDHVYQGKLDEVHEILLAFLLEIDRICRKHHIRYFLAGGTLLGAIRHHGFIPWDDDADVMMLREDYDRFCRVVQKELPSNLFFQTPETEQSNHQIFGKIRINNTIFATKFTSNFLEMHNGIFIDVLAHDATANSESGRKAHILVTRGCRALLMTKWKNTPLEADGKKAAAAKGLNLVKKLIPMTALESATFRAFTWFSGRKDQEFLYDGMGRNIKRGAFPKKWLEETIYVDFEGVQLPVPKEYNRYLTWLYGDYMQMIPVSERRVSHDIRLTDLGEYEEYRIPSEKGKERGIRKKRGND